MSTHPEASPGLSWAGELVSGDRAGQGELSRPECQSCLHTGISSALGGTGIFAAAGSWPCRGSPGTSWKEPSIFQRIRVDDFRDHQSRGGGEAKTGQRTTHELLEGQGPPVPPWGCPCWPSVILSCRGKNARVWHCPQLCSPPCWPGQPLTCGLEWALGWTQERRAPDSVGMLT